MKPVFLIGSRRSGTTMFTYAFNTHPEVYMASEADIIWYLYTGRSNKPHILSSDLFFENENNVSARFRKRHLFKDSLNLDDTEAFYEDLLYLKDNGIEGRQDAYPEKRDLKWVGDKSPDTNSDPEVYNWIMDKFPESKFIHLVRNPIYSIASMNGTWWRGSQEDIADRWCLVEDWCQEIEALTIRYEDICTDYTETMGSVWTYLGLDPELADSNLKRGEVMGDDYHKEFRRSKSSLKIDGRIKEYMSKYGYDNS